MNDYGKPQNDKAHQDDQAHELIEHLNHLEDVDRRITPEHVAKRFRELLDDIGDNGLASPAAAEQSCEDLDQPDCGPELPCSWREYGAEHWADPLGSGSSLEAAIAVARNAASDIIADAQLKAKAASEELLCTQEAVTAARLQVEQIVAAARTEADEALERAVKMIRDAGEQAAQIISDARQEAEQILTAARNQQVHRAACTRYGAFEAFPPQAERRLTAIHSVTERVLLAELTNLIGVPSDPGYLDELHPVPGTVTDSAKLAAVAAGVLAGRYLPGGNPSGDETERQRTDQGPQHDITTDQARGGPAASTLPADGQLCTLFAVDIEGFARQDRDDDIRRYLRESVYELLRNAFDSSGIPWDICSREDRGDGVLVVIPPGISVKNLIHPLPERLSSLLRRHNHATRPAANLQLRAATHIGPVTHDGHGFIGTDINFLFRMLDARRLKRTAADSGAELCLVVSDYVYSNVVCRYPSLMHPDTFRATRFQVKETRARAWTYLPRPGPSSRAPEEDGAGLRPSPHVNNLDKNAQGPTAQARAQERMSRLTMVPFTERPVLDSARRLILAVDVEGSTLRTNLMKGELRMIMYALLDRALRATEIDREHLEEPPIDRGDGVLLLFRPDDEVPKMLLLGQLIPRLAALLVEHNAKVAEPALRLRLRVVFHAGEIHDDGWGFYGEELDVAFRLLYSPSVKKALRDEPTFPLVLVISDEIHGAIARHDYVDVGPCARSVRVSVANGRRIGWVHFPTPLAAVQVKPTTRVPALVAAVPARTSEGSAADELALACGTVAR